MSRWLIGALLVLVLAPRAQAATFTAAADSPEQPGRAPAQDIARVTSTLDADTGTWAVTVALRGEPAEGTTGAVNAVLYPPAAACGAVPNDAAAYLRGNDAPGATDVSGTLVNGPRALEGRFKEHVPGSATVTLGATDPAFAGYTPGCVTVTLSRFGALDEVDAVPFSAPGQPAPVLPPLPPPAPPAPPLPAIAFAHPGGHLTLSKAGTVAIALKPFDQAVAGKLTVADARRHTLGRASYRARAGKAVTVKVRLNAATRRALRAGRRVKVTLTATVQLGTTTLTKRTTATVRR
jgi:hypothetical protein